MQLLFFPSGPDQEFAYLTAGTWKDWPTSGLIQCRTEMLLLRQYQEPLLKASNRLQSKHLNISDSYFSRLLSLAQETNTPLPSYTVP